MSVSKTIILTSSFLIAVTSSATYGAGSNKVAKVVTPDMIGADLAYLEKFTGPAKNTYDGGKKGEIFKNYVVDGCNINVNITNNKINNIGIGGLSKKCSFDLNKFIPMDFPPLHNLTFGKFDAIVSDGEITADCLGICGNAADPSVFYEWAAPHVYNWYEVQLISGGDEGVSTWEDAMRKGEGEDWIIERKYDCNREKYNKIAKKALKNAEVGAIQIGFGIIRNDCKP